MGKEQFINFIQREKSFRIITSTDLDSLLASGVILKTLSLHGYDVKVNIDPKYIIDEPREPLLLVNLKPIDPSKQVALVPDKDSSITGLVVTVLDEMFGVDKWDKILAIMSGLYRNLDGVSEGFKGVEKNILNHLLENREISYDLSFRLWGHKRVGLVKSFTRTLIPFLPGYTGARDRVEDLLKKATKSANVGSIQSSDFFTEQGKTMLVELVNLLRKTINAPQEYAKNVSLRIVGFDYSISIDTGQVELLEIVGALLVYTSLKRDNVFKILGCTQQTLSTQILSIYEEVIDEAAALLGSAVTEQLFSNKPVDVEGFFERPDLLVDIANEIPTLDPKIPVSIIYDGKTYTVLRELLKIGVQPSKAYESCDDMQLCVVTSGV